VELAVGDAGDSVALGLEATISGAVRFEPGRRGVGLAAFEFDDQALRRPERVELVAGDHGVRMVRARQAVRVEEAEEVGLEVGPGPVAPDLATVDDGP
jgi:hypothetical protein